MGGLVILALVAVAYAIGRTSQPSPPPEGADCEDCGKPARLVYEELELCEPCAIKREMEEPWP